jgi:hypothetical protein
MKSRRRRVLAILASIFATVAIVGVIQFRKIETVHHVAKLSTSEYFADQHRDFFFVAESVLNSDIVVRGTIVDPDSLVSASPKQSEVAYPQGWQVTRVRIDKLFSGHNQSTEIYIPSGWWPSPVVGNSFLQPFAKDEVYLFFLTEAEDLSRWTDTTVFSFSGQGPIPLPKSGSNKAEISSPITPRVD